MASNHGPSRRSLSFALTVAFIADRNHHTGIGGNSSRAGNSRAHRGGSAQPAAPSSAEAARRPGAGDSAAPKATKTCARSGPSCAAATGAQEPQGHSAPKRTSPQGLRNSAKGIPRCNPERVSSYARGRRGKIGLCPSVTASCRPKSCRTSRRDPVNFQASRCQG